MINDPSYRINNPWGITSGGGYIWITNDGGSPGTVTQVSAATGALIRVIRSPENVLLFGSASGRIVWDGTHVWVLNRDGEIAELPAATWFSD